MIIMVIHLSMVCPTWQILEKGGGFAVGIFPKGWVLSQDCHIQTPVSSCHTLSAIATGDIGYL